MQRSLDKLQSDLAQEAIELYKETVADFKTPIEFTAEEIRRDGKRILNIYARGDGNADGKKISPRALYRNLDKGFQRKVRMTHDFTPKTQPGRLRSQPGSGGVFIGKKGPVFIPPVPVEPRNFTEQIAEILRERLKDRVRSIRG